MSKSFDDEVAELNDAITTAHYALLRLLVTSWLWRHLPRRVTSPRAPRPGRE